MKRPEYLGYYEPYAKEIKLLHRVTGETDKYWTLRRNEVTVYIRKSNLKERGCTNQWYALTKEEAFEIFERRKVLSKINKIKFESLDTKTLKAILKLTGVKDEV